MNHKLGRTIIGYQPEIPIVTEDGHRLTLRAEVPDWASHDDILHDLALRAGVSTVGELVDVVRAGNNLDAACHVEPGSPRFAGDPVGCHERIG